MMAALHRLLVRAPFAVAVPLAGRRYGVTGVAPGSIGYATARALAAWGAAVTVSTRRDTAAVVARLAGELRAAGLPAQVDGHPLDLADAGSVARYAQAVVDGGGLDGLVNNAGIHLDLMSDWKAPNLTADGHEIHWRTNYLGTMQLTQALWPALRAAAAQRGEARIVNVVSMLHARGNNAELFRPQAKYSSWVAYGLSKLALVHATFEMQRRYAAGERIQAYCLHPGAVSTNIAARGFAGYRGIELLRRVLSPVEALFLLTPDEGAQTSLLCATQPGLAGGRYFRACQPAEPSTDAHDAAVAARLWDETQAALRKLA
ncbi:MAG: SDR family NAD(P)-dependent oxidoreductase [Solimonas sp.]